MVELGGICWDWVGYALIGWDGLVLSGVGIYFIFCSLLIRLLSIFLYLYTEM